MKTIKLSAIGLYHSYQKESLLPILLSSMGYKIEWVDSDKCDILIIGKPINSIKYFLKSGLSHILPEKYNAYKGIAYLLPDPLNRFIQKNINQRHYRPLTLFHTCENIRPEAVKSDYSISFDFGGDKQRNFRLPYWMEMVDWSHEGVSGNKNVRFGRLFSIQRMMQPLGKSFLAKPRKAAIFATHLDGPRKGIYHAVNNAIETDGFGKYFNKKIISHSKSGFEKYTILREYAFNLCPENKLHPGYYTEKIPEAFLADSLPITWADSKVSVDFNPKAFINLQQLDWHNAELLHELLHSEKQLASYAEQPLLLEAPSIEPFRDFLRNILLEAL